MIIVILLNIKLNAIIAEKTQKYAVVTGTLQPVATNKVDSTAENPISFANLKFSVILIVHKMSKLMEYAYPLAAFVFGLYGVLILFNKAPFHFNRSHNWSDRVWHMFGFALLGYALICYDGTNT